METLNKVYSKDGKSTGKLTGGTRKCQMESCKGERIGVRWHDGKLTWPCSCGMKTNEDGSQQIV